MNNQKCKRSQIVPETLLLAGLVLALASCSTTGDLDFTSYPKIPDTPTSAVYRAAAKSNPFTGKAAFYGNYGGPSNRGGEPVDRMDELFRRHDLAYYHCRSLPTMIKADQELVIALKQMDPKTLSPQSLSFRKRAVGFFSSPPSRVVGKPISSFFQAREKPQSCFAGENAVHEFFTSEEDPFLSEETMNPTATP